MTESWEQSLRQTELKYREAWETMNLDRLMQFFAEDAVLMTAGRDLIEGRDAIKQELSRPFATPGLKTQISPRHTSVNGGNLAYSIATYTSSVMDASGEKMSHDGKYVTVWQMVGQGQWRVVVHSASMSSR